MIKMIIMFLSGWVSLWLPGKTFKIGLERTGSWTTAELRREFGLATGDQYQLVIKTFLPLSLPINLQDAKTPIILTVESLIDHLR